MDKKIKHKIKNEYLNTQIMRPNSLSFLMALIRKKNDFLEKDIQYML